ncbi:hypothetical protein SJA_C2-02790 [Sphingobium indicum UT26S]|uniref:Uncharacterized protein n=1 Tax=Sphingobium indicum (strain DSM 16413 / CCM 7287 / MTCC 6362 / UT26 / NBRC 101211 / UT26S) TaxID=452662 RepID=D4Z823_SPHIU|nr:hypothetical protein SJA_C2-02790 [Sphingobium indicum UT26S]
MHRSICIGHFHRFVAVCAPIAYATDGMHRIVHVAERSASTGRMSMAFIRDVMRHILGRQMEGVLTAEYAITRPAVGRKAAIMQARLTDFGGVT